MRDLIDVRVYFEDTDFSGVVYHANYLKFFERGRSDALRKSGYDHRHLIERADPLAFTVRNLRVAYHRPARIDDMLTVETILTELRGARMLFVQHVWRKAVCLATAEVEVAAMDNAGRARRIPREITEKLVPSPLTEGPPHR